MLEMMETVKKTGKESFCGMNHTLLDFWSWAHSDINSNAERGVLAEYIVRCALHIDSSCRTEWDAWDMILCEDDKTEIKVEVKCSAYLQTWKQKAFSSIRFDIAPKYIWDYETNQYSTEKKRPADVYVFCLFASKEPTQANPLDISQWEFYVLRTQVLNTEVPEQKSIALNTLIRLGAKKVDFDGIYDAVKKAGEKL